MDSYLTQINPCPGPAQEATRKKRQGAHIRLSPTAARDRNGRATQLRRAFGHTGSKWKYSTRKTKVGKSSWRAPGASQRPARSCGDKKTEGNSRSPPLR